MKKRTFSLKLLSVITAMCMAITPVFATPFHYNGTEYNTDPADPSAMSDLEAVTLSSAAGKGTNVYSGTAYFSPSKNLLVLDGGTASGTLTNILDGATYDGGTDLTANNVAAVSATGTTLQGSVFLNTPNLVSVDLEGDVQITNVSDPTKQLNLFANCQNLTRVTVAGSTVLALPANIAGMFGNTPKLTSIPDFNYAAVTNATNAFRGSGVTELDLSTATGITTDTGMFVHATKLTKLMLGKKPTAASGWTSRWWYDANNDGNLTADETAMLADDWMAATTVMQFTQPYRMMTTKAQYTTAGLASSIYYVESLDSNNTYRLDDEPNKLSSYCINWIADYPDGHFFEFDSVDTAANLEGYLDVPGTYGDVVISRNLENYGNDALKALQTILFFGYPNNGTGAFEETGAIVDEQAYYAATQALIWHVLSGVAKDEALTAAGVNNTKSQAAYGILEKFKYSDYMSAIDGIYATDVTVYIPDTGTVQNMVSGNYSVMFSKFDYTGTAELPGAQLTVSTGSTITPGNTVDSWTSTTTPHIITGLVPGDVYYLTEVTAPAGYAIAEQISFVAGGHFQYEAMLDNYATHTVTVKKMDDATTPARVAGAVLTLTGTDFKGTAITARTVTTTATADAAFTGLLPGTYQITETTTPEGYLTASPISFSITATDPTADATNYTYTMTDKKVKYGKASINKVDPKGKALSGATLKLTDNNGKEILTFTSDTSARTVENLIVGITYTLEETSAPDGYEKADKITFTVNEGATTTVKMTDKYKKHKLIIKKQDDEGNRVSGATLQITGSTLGGDTIDTITFTTSGDSDKEVTLYPGNYKVTETTTPEGYTTASAASVTISLTDDEKTVTLIDKKKVDPNKKTTDNTKKDTSGSKSEAKAAKTFDSAPIGLLVALAVVAFGAIGAGIVIIRKKKK